MFFKTLYLSLAMIILLLGAVLVEAVWRERAHAKRLLVAISGIYALSGLTALLCSLANV